MRIHLSILALTILGSAITAQTNQQFELYGWRTSYTDRGTLGTGGGELFQGFHSSHNLGIAEDGSNVNFPAKAELTQLAVVHQDQNGSTVETFDLVIRSGTDAAGPDGTTAGLIAEVTGLALPTSTTNGAVAWIQTYTLAATSLIPVPVDKFWAYGSRLTASPNWVSDGHGIHTTWSTAALPHHNSWNEQVTTGNVGHAWELTGTATVANVSSASRTWRYTVGHTGVAMQLGCGAVGAPGVGFGMGGMFPASSDATTPLPFVARVRGGTGLAGAANVVSLAPLGLFPIAVPFGSGANLYINPASMMLFFGPPADAAGEATINIAPFIPVLNIPGLSVPFQAAMDSAATGVRLSNVMFAEPK